MADRGVRGPELRWPVGEEEELKEPTPLSWRRVIAICVLLAFTLLAVLSALFVSAVGSWLSCRNGCSLRLEILLPITLFGAFAGAVLLTAVRATPILARPDHPDRERRPFEIGLIALWGMAGVGAGFSYMAGAFRLGAQRGASPDPQGLAWLALGAAAVLSATLVTGFTIRHLARQDLDVRATLHRTAYHVLTLVAVAHLVAVLGGGPSALGLPVTAVLAAVVLGVTWLMRTWIGPPPPVEDEAAPTTDARR